MSDAAKSKAKQKWAIEKPQLDNARRLRCIFFIEPDDEEFRHTLKNARRKLEIRCEQHCLCLGETCRNHGKNKTNMCLYCRCRRIYGNTIGRYAAQYHEDHISAKGIHSLSHYNLVHKFIPMPQALM